MTRREPRLSTPPSGALLRAVTGDLTRQGQLAITPLQLFYELVRRGALSAKADRARWERTWRRVAPRGVVDVRSTPARGPFRRDQEGDVYDYTVRRAVVFPVPELVLAFARSGFHRKIEVALLSMDGYPHHVWDALEGQLERGMKTSFLLVQDLAPRVSPAARRLRERLVGYPAARLVDLGLRPEDADRLRLTPIRGAAPLEAAEPVRLMRWVYGRISRGAKEVGFG